MTYDLSLKWVTLVIGFLYLAGHLPGVLAPELFAKIARRFPRHYPAGVILTLAAGIWFCWLTATTDLGEMSPWRNTLVSVWAAGTILMVIFVPTFLAVRGLAFLLLLGTEVILSAAFMTDTDARYVMTVLAYVWAIVGMILVASPYHLRDALEWAFKTPQRCRILCAAGSLFGVLLLILGAFVYAD
jgi:hypothetical protein